MSARHAGAILSRDVFKLGPRSPFLLFALIVPVLLTFLIQGVFGDLFVPEPRLAIADEGKSTVSTAAVDLEGITVTFADSEAEMLGLVETNDADAGLYLPPGFDDAVVGGEQPPLHFYVSGDSLASNRIILGVTAMDLVRDVEGSEPPVDVVVNQVGEAAVDLDLRMVPLLLMYAVGIGAGFMTASNLVQEKEDRTLSALLVSPASIGDVLTAKGAFGVLLGMITGFAILILNDAILGQAGTHFVILLVASLMMVEFGLLLGMWAKDANSMFAAWKGGGILLFYPSFFFIFPNLPQWIGKLSPTYWFMSPAFRIAAEGASFGDVAVEIAIAAVVVLALAPGVYFAARHLERNLAAG